MDGKFVAYYRVSRKTQGADGLGIDAQKRAVTGYLNGGDWTLVGEFTEVESGGKGDRPALLEAIKLAQMTKAKLLIAKLDRLSRDVHFLTGLEKAGVDFVCCDMPQANRVTIHIMAAIAQDERERISRRTKEGLASIKAKLERGEEHVSKRSGKVVTRLGGTVGGNPPQDRAVAAVKAQAATFAGKVGPTISALREAGHTLQQVADRLNEMGVVTSRGSSWTPMAVKRVEDRLARA